MVIYSVHVSDVVGEVESAYNATFVHGSARIEVFAKFNEFFSDDGTTIGEFIKIVYNGCDSVEEAISRLVITSEQKKRDYEQLSKKLAKFEGTFDCEREIGHYLRDVCRTEIKLDEEEQ